MDQFMQVLQINNFYLDISRQSNKLQLTGQKLQLINLISSLMFHLANKLEVAFLTNYFLKKIFSIII